MKYDRLIKKFYDFHSMDLELIGPLDFKDANIAVYLYAMGEENDWKPHCKKCNMAAINNQLKALALPNIFDFAHFYPKTHRILSVSYHQI